jgi:hypothetical protein
MLTERGLLYFEDGSGGGMGGGCFKSKEISRFHQKRNFHEYFGVRVSGIQNGMVRVPHIQIGIKIGDNLAHN